MEHLDSLFKNSRNSIKNIRDDATKQLQALTLTEEILHLIFSYLASNQVQLTEKLNCAIFLKNYIKDYWDPDEEDQDFESKLSKVPSNEAKEYFKSNILLIFLDSDPKIMSMIIETIFSICKKGYLEVWPNIMIQIGGFLVNENTQIQTKIMFYDLVHKLIKRYRFEFKSDALYEEIIETLKIIPKLIQNDCYTALSFIYSQGQKNQIDIVKSLKIVKFCFQIFHSLNWQDFPEYFEDNLQAWMQILQGSLGINPANLPQSKEINIEIIKVHSICMRALNHYCQSYYDDFKDYYNSFVEIIWNLTQTITQEEKYSRLAKRVIDYYKGIIQLKKTSDINDKIQYIVDKLIIPNMVITDKEYSDFEDNPVGFLKIELEEVDCDSVKYYAIELLKEMGKCYNNLIPDYINPTINNLMNEYSVDSYKNHSKKIVAINLIFACVIKNFSSLSGVTEMVIPNEEISIWLKKIFFEEFQNTSYLNSFPLVKIYSIKFLIYFRQFIPYEWLGETLKLLISKAATKDAIIMNACLLAIEKILFMKDLNYNKSTCLEVMKDKDLFVALLKGIFDILNNDLNIQALKCLLRSIILCEIEFIGMCINELINIFNKIIEVLVRVPDDQFNYYLFETISLVVKKLEKCGKIDGIEYFNNGIEGLMRQIYENNINDLLSYVIQTVSLIISITRKMNDFQQSLVNQILINPALWVPQMKFLFISNANLVKALISSHKTYLIQNNGLNSILKIIDTLIKSRLETAAFSICEYLIHFFTFEEFGEGINQIFIIFFQNLSELKQDPQKVKLAVSLSKNIILFISKFIINFGCQTLVNFLNSMQAGYLESFIESDIGNMRYLSTPQEKKIALYGFCSLLNDIYLTLNIKTVEKMVIEFVKVLQTFYSTSFDFTPDKTFELQESFVYVSNSNNKILNAEIKINFENISKVTSLDQNDLFFQVISNIKNNTSTNILNLVIPNLNQKEQKYLEKIINK